MFRRIVVVVMILLFVHTCTSLSIGGRLINIHSFTSRFTAPRRLSPQFGEPNPQSGELGMNLGTMSDSVLIPAHNEIKSAQYSWKTIARPWRVVVGLILGLAAIAVSVPKGVVSCLPLNIQARALALIPWNVVSLAMGCISVLTAAFNFSESLNETISLASLTRECIKELRYSIESATVVFNEPYYITRACPEAELNIIKASEPTGSYFIIYGARGSGKTKLTAHMASNRSATIRVAVNRASNQQDVISLLSSKLLGKSPPYLDIYAFIEAVEKCNVVPLIVFDVERGQSEAQAAVLEGVRSVAKQLAEKCICLIVLSEANAVLEFGHDAQREKYLFIDELTRVEAKEFINIRLKSAGLTIDEGVFDYVFKNIGSNPAMLVNLVSTMKKNGSIKDFVEDILADAEDDLREFPHQAILCELKKNPNGVAHKTLNRMDQNINLSFPRAVAKGMKESNAIIYRKELKKYQLMSTAHRTALDKYIPIDGDDCVK